MTVDEFFALGPELPSHTQLIDGVVVVNTPGDRHQAILFWLGYLWHTFAEGHEVEGRMSLELDVPIGERDVLAPDAWWAPEGRGPLPVGRFEVPPPLVVEVRSPSTWAYDTGVKLRRYEEAGVEEVWLVDTAVDEVVVRRRSSADAPFDVRVTYRVGDVLTTPLVPGFEIDVARLFDR